MSAETSAAQGRDEHFLRVFRRGFRTWRGQRPFWAGLFTMLGGLPIAYLPYADLRLGNITLAMATTAGAGSLIIGVLLVTLGLTMWFQAPVRVFSGIAAIVLALISIPVANIGGFLIGFLCALLGGALAISWAPGTPASEAAAHAAKADLMDDPHPLDDPHRMDEPTVPAPRADEVYDPNVTETTAHADGGRNSAG
ncbi:DUF6114 domain-containing protein [Streptomyces sp. t39]|uniref:DUF6114 domain-containing protein n=1 Tax=Streptomyces sp. t39 TaxID=1828156 RepID=UPI0011CE83E3|nr:DUF6114 domain-containing protein [Streptomyces sp. t39]TXS56967.1 hypothetical protein EAO77_13300 [Streptomyces sp. t39]